MTIPIVPKPEFPTVPNASGVPPVPRSPSVPPPSTTYSGADSRTLPVDVSQKVWGIYDENNNPALIVDSILVVNPSNNAKVSDFPVEEGGFVSFNKVQTPYAVKVRISVGGDEVAMTNVLDALAGMLLSVDLFSVVTPFEVYTSATLESYNYSQESRRGACRIEAELMFKEVRQVSPQFTSVKLPAAKVKNAASASKQENGKQQPQTQKTSALASGVNGVSNWLKR